MAVIWLVALILGSAFAIASGQGAEVESPECGHYPGLHGRRARSRLRIRFRERESGIRSQRRRTVRHDVRNRWSDGLRGAKHMELEGVSRRRRARTIRFRIGY